MHSGNAQWSKEQLTNLSGEVLPTLDQIASTARQKLAIDSPGGAEGLINPSDAAIANLDRVQSTVRENYRRLTVEPAIARVVALTIDGEERIYYICRVAPVSGVKSLASYRAPIGRLASLPIGGELELPDGTILEVQGRAVLRPTSTAQGWDSIRTVLEADGFGTVTVESLRSLLEAGDTIEDLVSELMEAAALDENVAQGVRRNLITKMELRDQPLLDQYQDKIFRLPLDTRGGLKNQVQHVG
ncbi:MAG: hypothetical protein JSR26_05150 [Proteobacteria bacterium]|nr:hypothetical protein [Pseudomonadota bacterium]